MLTDIWFTPSYTLAIFLALPRVTVGRYGLYPTVENNLRAPTTTPSPPGLTPHEDPFSRLVYFTACPVQSWTQMTACQIIHGQISIPHLKFHYPDVPGCRVCLKSSSFDIYSLAICTIPPHLTALPPTIYRAAECRWKTSCRVWLLTLVNKLSYDSFYIFYFCVLLFSFFISQFYFFCFNPLSPMSWRNR